MTASYLARKSVGVGERKSLSNARPSGSESGKTAFAQAVVLFGSESGSVFGASTLEKKVDIYSSAISARLGVFVGVDPGTSCEVKWASSMFSESTILAVSGADTSAPYETSGSNLAAASKEPSITGITTAHANELVIAVFVEGEGEAATPPSGWTERLDNPEEEVFQLHIATLLKESAGATGNQHFTLGKSVAGIGAMLAIKPPEEAPVTQPLLSMVV